MNKFIKTKEAYPISGISILQTLGLWIGISAFIGSISWYLASSVAAWQRVSLPILVVVAECYALLSLVIFFRYGGFEGLRDRIKVRYTSLRDIMLAICFCAGILVLSFVGYVVYGIAEKSIWAPVLQVVHDATDMSRLPTADTTAWIFILIRVLLLAGIAEELLFRGLLFGWLRSRFSATITILVTSVLFTVEHYFLILFPIVFIYGLVSGWLREKTGSVLPGIVMHILTDGIFLLIAYVLVLKSHFLN